MSAHTPGPWKAQTFATSWKVWPISRRKADGSAVAYDCTEADARLIAAAPELLEALRYLLDNQGDYSAAGIAICREAIAKAEGRSWTNTKEDGASMAGGASRWTSRSWKTTRQNATSV